MDLEVRLSSERPIPADAVRELYESVGWFPEREDSEIADVLGKCLAVGAWRDKRLVGFARAISDDRFHAYIDDVVVDPEFQRRGLGRRLVSRLAAALSRVNEISLFTGGGNVSFYESIGFKLWETQRVLHLRNKA